MTRAGRRRAIWWAVGLGVVLAPVIKLLLVAEGDVGLLVDVLIEDLPRLLPRLLLLAPLFFAVLVVVHEFGHVLAAVVLRVPIGSVDLGVGRVVLSPTWGGVRVRMRVLPLGGYVATGPTNRVRRSVVLLGGIVSCSTLAVLAHLFIAGGPGQFLTRAGIAGIFGGVEDVRQLLEQWRPVGRATFAARDAYFAGDVEHALELVLDARALDMTNDTAQMWHALILADTGRTDEALEVWDARNPPRSSADWIQANNRAWIGLVSADAEHRRAACAGAQRAFDLRSEEGGVRGTQALAYVELGRPKDALALLAQIDERARLPIEIAGFRATKALALASLGLYDEARAAADAAAALSPHRAVVKRAQAESGRPAASVGVQDGSAR